MEYVWVCHGDDFAELCRKSQETVKHHDPGAVLTVYTDKKYKLEGEIVIPYYHDFPFMLMNVMCQAAYLAEHGVCGNTVVFMDVDAFMVDRLPNMGNDWDVGVTWRDDMGNLSMLMPYNYGILFANHSVQSIASWFWMCDRIAQMSPKNKKWYGNQIALRELCGPINYEETISTRTHDYFNLRVKHFPCNKYNWTPPDDQPKVSPSGKYFVHFKGNRKDLADWYYGKCMEAA